jgi:hypothetical protein
VSHELLCFRNLAHKTKIRRTTFTPPQRPAHAAHCGLFLLRRTYETDVPIDKPQKMVLGDVIFQAKVVKQRLRTGVLTHHDEQASENGNQENHQQEL